MNDWKIEYMAEFHRQDLIKEREQIKLTELARKHSLAYRHGMFTRTMHGFAAWMISTGKKLHKRYELPTAHSHQKPSSSFVR